ncbi:MAG: hypothetical protein ABII71_05160 [Candidatus Micrarchaeota archaeon]
MAAQNGRAVDQGGRSVRSLAHRKADSLAKDPRQSIAIVAPPLVSVRNETPEKKSPLGDFVDGVKKFVKRVKKVTIDSDKPFENVEKPVPEAAMGMVATRLATN